MLCRLEEPAVHRNGETRQQFAFGARNDEVPRLPLEVPRIGVLEELLLGADGALSIVRQLTEFQLANRDRVAAGVRSLRVLDEDQERPRDVEVAGLVGTF